LVLGGSKLATYWLTFAWLPDYFDELKRHVTDLSDADFKALKVDIQIWGQITLFVGMVCFGIIADLAGRRPAFTLYGIIMAAGMLALAMLGPEMLRERGWLWLAMSAVGFGSGCTAGFGAFLAELFPTSLRNTAMGTI